MQKYEPASKQATAAVSELFSLSGSPSVAETTAATEILEVLRLCVCAASTQRIPGVVSESLQIRLRKLLGRYRSSAKPYWTGMRIIGYVSDFQNQPQEATLGFILALAETTSRTDPQEACHWADRALKLSASSKAAPEDFHRRLATVYLSLRNESSAIEALKQCTSMPQIMATVDQLIHEKQITQAISVASATLAAVKPSPERCLLLQRLADCYQIKGEHQSALKVLRAYSEMP